MILAVAGSASRPSIAIIGCCFGGRFLDRVHQAVSLLKILDRLLTDFILELYRSGPCRVWIKVRNPASIAVQRERSEIWNR
jgi:hypothetical protein